MDGTFVRVPVGLLQTNCYIASMPDRDDCIVVDPGADAAKIRNALQGKHIAAILLTHGHFDHIGAADLLMEEGTKLYIHKQDAALLTDPALNVSWMVNGHCSLRTVPVTVEEGDVIKEAGMELQVLHTPGHTAGSVCYICDDVMFTGDTVMANGCGRTDLPSGSDEAMEHSLELLRAYVGKKQMLGGHG